METPNSDPTMASRFLEDIAHQVQEGYPDRVREAVDAALGGGLSAFDILNQGLVPGMNRVAEKFKKGQMFLPEVLAVAGAMKSGMSIVRPLLEQSGVRPEGKILLGTVRGDLHDIGKNLVGIMLQGAGFEVIDLGTDVRAEEFVEAAMIERPDIVGLSALLTTTMTHMPGVVEALEKAGLRKNVRVIIGGAPVSRGYAETIKADGYARDAATAVDLVRELLARHPQ